MRNIYAAIVMCVAVLPISACAKSDAEMCAAMAMQIAKLTTLSEAPMNATPDMIEYQTRNRLNGDRLQSWTRRCVEKKAPSNNKNHYECSMSAKTLNELYACDEKFPSKKNDR